MKQEQKNTASKVSAHSALHEARELMESGQPVEVLRLIESLAEPIQQSGWAQFLRARALMKTGDTEQSWIALDAAAQAGVPEKAVLEARSVLQKLTNDKDGLSVTLARLIELNPDNLTLHVRSANNMMELSRAEDARDAARTARDLAPENPVLHGLVCKVAIHFGDIKGYVDALEYALKHLPGPLPPGPRVISHLRMLPVRDVGTISARVNARWQESRPATKSVNPAPQQTWRRPLLQQQPGANLLCSPPGDSGITIVWFAGMAEKKFDLLQAVDSHASAAGCNAIYVCDPERSMYLPVDRANDPLTSLLREEIARYGTKKLIVCGVSIGAVAALFYGLALKADRLISLSGPTTGRPDQRNEIKDRRAPMVIANLHNTIPLELLDLRLVIMDASKAKRRTPFRYDIYFGADRLTDRRHAERVADIPGVRLFPIEGFAEHRSFFALAERGRAGEIFTV